MTVGLQNGNVGGFDFSEDGQQARKEICWYNGYQQSLEMASGKFD